MLTTRQKTLRKFWYATMPLHFLNDGPKPFRLMGEDIVLFLDAGGEPAALRDRCRHRTAKLSKGWCSNGTLVCVLRTTTTSSYNNNTGVLLVTATEAYAQILTSLTGASSAVRNTSILRAH